MASLRKHPRSPFWHACFTLPDGRRTNKSTGATDKRKAQRIANEYEDAAREASEGRFIESRARKVLADIFALANTEKLASSTVGDFLDSWLKRKELEASEGTFAKYQGVVAQFREYLGQAKLLRDVTAITARDFTGFRDALAQRVSPGTVNVALKIIRSSFAQAHKDGLIDVNEACRVSTLKRDTSNSRRAFTLQELRRILDVADGEWRGLVLFGLYTGQRLGDLASLTWHNLDLQRQEVRFVTSKTGRQQIIPMAKPLAQYVEKLPAGDKPDAPLFPSANDIVTRQGRTGTLSNQFYALLVAAGLSKERSHQGTGKGRGAKRDGSAITFHCLRHTATSLLKNAGVSESVAMEFVGHDSSSVSRNYTHIETSALRKAAAKLPDVTL